MPSDSPGQTPSSRQERIRAAITDCFSRRATGEDVSDEQVIAAHTDLMPELGQELAKRAAVDHDRITSIDATIDLPSPTPNHQLRDSIPGYQIGRKLSEGGQGVIYLAFQKSTRRKVAVKMMRKGPFASQSDKARFDREVQILARLHHPNIVAIHDSGTAAGGHYFIMDYIAGQSLDEYMRSPDGPGSIKETLRLFEKICSAVNAPHLAGIIHRDLKPSNIRIDNDGEPYILDFGLAKVSLSDSEVSMMTMTGQFVGSLPWSAPEQAGGTSDKVDVRTDVYSLGVILYQMLTDQFPYEVTGNMRDVMDRIMRAEPRRASELRREINDEVDTIVLKCLCKERERRYQSAGELARDIQHYLNGQPIEAKRDSIGYLMRKQLVRHKAPVAVVVGFVAVILIGLVTSLTLWRRAESEGANARFRLEAARSEVTRNLEEYQVLLPKLRRAEDLVVLLPDEVQRRYPQGSPSTTYLEATDWITDLFHTSPDTVPDEGHTSLNTQIRDVVKSCARYPEHSRDPIAVAWIQANQDDVNRLVEIIKQHRFFLGTSPGNDLLIHTLLPSLQDARFGVEILTACALVHHDEGNNKMAIENLDAATRLSRYIGDGATLIHSLVEISCRNAINNAYRWMVSDIVAGESLPPAYVTFLRKAPPLPDFEHSYVMEVRVFRQILNEAFVKTNDQAPARLDLTHLRDLIDNMEIEENPYADPSPTMIADANTLDFEQAVSFITELCSQLHVTQDTSFRKIKDYSERLRIIKESHPALSVMMPDFTRALELRRETQMNRDATVITVAIWSFQQSTGWWPESIDDALASFDLKPYFRNYYGQDFVYKIVHDMPLLYVIGPNGIDDGGRGRRFGSKANTRNKGAADDVLFLVSGIPQKIYDH